MRGITRGRGSRGLLGTAAAAVLLVVIATFAAVTGGLPGHHRSRPSPSARASASVAPQPSSSPSTSSPTPGYANVFTPTGSLAVARLEQTATLLADGRVLVVGGTGDASGFLASAEIWDPAAETFSPAGSLAQPRSLHSATLLADGRVLIIGGRFADDKSAGTLASAEVWNPATETFSPAGSLAQSRYSHTATLLRDGRVLVIGGSDLGYTARASAEVWDPATETFSPAGSLAQGRHDHTATLLPDGRVLVVGGASGRLVTNHPLASAELWDPGTGTFSPVHASLAEVRWRQTATLLPGGQVLIIGGHATDNSGFNDAIASAELWDPTSGSFGPAGAMASGRVDHTATLLPDGHVLVVGGIATQQRVATASTEAWDPTTLSFSTGPSLGTARMWHTATLLPDGRVLVVGGGIGGGDVPLASAEIYH